jgi:hypothetical protein
VIEASVAQLLGERAEAEPRRVRAVRPHLGSRCGRAEDILVSHLDCGGTSGVIRIRVRGEKLVGFLVRGSGGSVYRVEPWGSWRCSCPDHHRRGKACKHALACWALWRASARPAAAEVCWACSRAAWGRAPGGLSGAPRGARREAGGRVMAAPSTIGGEAFRRRVQLKVELASIERPPR